MKKLLAALTLPVLFAACNEEANKINQVSGTDTADLNKNSIEVHYNDTTSGYKIITPYFEIKNALAADDGRQAASAARKYINSLSNMENLGETLEDAKEMAEHIAKNGKDIQHQRFHFQMLSDDMYEFIKDAKINRTLYWDFCPMYNDRKGGTWLSETKEIKNPYLGKKMPACGEIKEVIK
jgi:hypothetical protein